MSEPDWYEVTEGPELLQGDILAECPVYTVSGGWRWPILTDSEVDVDVKSVSLVVMTQSCDLANGKVEDVLAAQLIDWPSAVRAEVKRGNEFMKSAKTRVKLIEGTMPALSLLHKRDADPVLPWSVVDFHRLHTLPKAYATDFVKSLGPRLRLRSPYREHPAQAFARYFMRVGLPHNARAFEKDGEVKL